MLTKSSALSVVAEKVGARLHHAGLVLATAESCTGGGIASIITSVPGSSVWFDRGFVTYSNVSKEELLGVPVGLILSKGAVSREVVLAMAKGALDGSRADIAVAVSGVAGPGGGTPEKPVGTVWMALMERGASGMAFCRHFAGCRESVRNEAILAVLNGLMEHLSSRPEAKIPSAY